MADGVTAESGMTYGNMASTPVTLNLTTQMTTLLPQDGGLRCDYINTDYNIVAAILCFMCFMFGVLYTFFGRHHNYFYFLRGAGGISVISAFMLYLYSLIMLSRF